MIYIWNFVRVVIYDIIWEEMVTPVPLQRWSLMSDVALNLLTVTSCSDSERLTGLLLMVPVELAVSLS